MSSTHLCVSTVAFDLRRATEHIANDYPKDMLVGEWRAQVLDILDSLWHNARETGSPVFVHCNPSLQLHDSNDLRTRELCHTKVEHLGKVLEAKDDTRLGDLKIPIVGLYDSLDTIPVHFVLFTRHEWGERRCL